MRQLTLISCLCLAAWGGQESSGTAAPAPEASAVPAAAQPAAPAKPAVEEGATPAIAAQGSRAVLNDYLSAWNGHDGNAVAGFFADDAVVFDSLRGNLSNGRSKARAEVIDMYLRAVPDGQWSLRGEPVVSESGFSYEWALKGTNMGDWTSYLRGRGQKIDFKGISIVRLKDGKIVYQANYFDTNALGAQAGW